MRTFADLEELAGLGPDAPLGASGWVEVTQRMIDLFAEATGDRQWIHVDAERAASGPYGGTIAHGHLTLSLLPQLVSQLWSIAGDPVRVNYGLDHVRFLAPVKVGSRLRAVCTVTRVERLAGGGVRVHLHSTVEVEGAQRPACVADTIVQIGA